jgi:tripartite-type tricarboxylate transporter receptor subunit TctC
MRARSACRLCIAAILAALLSVVAQSPVTAADQFPKRPIKLVVPFPAGGINDLLARLVAQDMARSFGSPVIVENKPGASGNVGADLVAKAAKDGYTIGLLNGIHTANAGFYRRLDYDIRRDFMPLAGLGESPVLLVGRQGLPYATFTELLAYARNNPGKVNFGSSTNLVIDLLRVKTALDVNIVLYKGSGQVVTELLSAQIDIAAAPILDLLTYIQNGDLRVVAVAGPRRLPQFPDAQAIGESVENFDATVWYGLFAPNGIAPEIAVRLRETIARALADEAVSARLASYSIDPGFGRATPEQIQERIAAEVARWKEVAAKTGAYAD